MHTYVHTYIHTFFRHRERVSRDATRAALLASLWIHVFEEGHRHDCSRSPNSLGPMQQNIKCSYQSMSTGGPHQRGHSVHATS